MSRILRNAPVSEPDPRRSGAGGPSPAAVREGSLAQVGVGGSRPGHPGVVHPSRHLAPAAAAAAAAVGQGFTVTPSDLAYILKQIKIAEAHVANTTSATGPCGALLGTGPTSSPARCCRSACGRSTAPATTSSPGKERNGAADQVFPRLADARVQGRRRRDPPPSGRPDPRRTPRRRATSSTPSRGSISNLIVDQTSTNPAAIAAAGFPVRTQGNPGVVPCTTDPDPLADPPVAAVPGGLHAVARDAVHPQRDHRRRSLAAVQLAVHAVRPVLRPRRRPDRQGRRHGLRPAEGRRPAGRRARTTCSATRDDLDAATCGSWC